MIRIILVRIFLQYIVIGNEWIIENISYRKTIVNYKIENDNVFNRIITKRINETIIK